MTTSYSDLLQALPPELASKVLQAELRRRLDLNPLRYIQTGDGRIVPLTPTPKQLEALKRSEAPKIFGFFGGNRAGKSVFALFRVCSLALGVPWTHWPALPLDPSQWVLGPPKKIWAITISFEKSRDGVQNFLWNRIPRSLWSGCYWNKKNGFHGRIATLTNGTTFYFKTCEQDIRTFESVAIDHAWIDETIPQEYFQATLPRLVDNRGKLTWTTIPDDPFIDDLFNRRQLDPGQKNIISAEDIDSVWGEMFDNPHIDRREIELLSGTLDPLDREMRIYGRFAYRRGLVYGDFDHALHLTTIDPPLTTEQYSNRVEIIDPGWENPCAVVFGFLDKVGTRWAYDEIYTRHTTVGELAAMIYLNRWLWRGLMTPAEALEYRRLCGLPTAGDTAERPVPTSTSALLTRNAQLAEIIETWRSLKGDCAPRVTLADNYSNQRDQAKAVPFRLQLAEFGIDAVPASNYDKDSQRNAVRTLLRPAGGQVRLKINYKCEWGIWEFAHHRHAEPNENIREYVGDRERVVDGNNHFLSGIEYWASHPLGYDPLPTATAPRSSPAGHERERIAKEQHATDWRRRG